MTPQKLIFIICLFGYFSSFGQEADFTTETTSVKFTKSFDTELKITSPANLQEKNRGFSTVNTSSVNIKGTVVDKNGIKKFMINNYGIKPKSNGSFSQNILLAEGENLLKFVITDKGNNVFEKTYKIISESPGPVLNGSTSMTESK